MNSRSAPLISVVIPTYNRADIVLRCLDGLCRQTVPQDRFEVIVVVDGSTDGTVQLLNDLETPYALTVLQQANQGSAAARNHGLRHAKGRFVLLLDDDIIVDPGLVAAHLQAHDRAPNHVVIGHIRLEIPADADAFVRHYQRQWDAHYRTLAGHDAAPSWMDGYSGNISMAREDLLAIGGLAEDLVTSVDVEMCYRLAQRGLHFVYAPDAVGIQRDDKGTRDLLRDAEIKGAAWIDVVRRHPAMAPPLLHGYANQSLREARAHRLLFRLGPIYGWLLRAGTLIRSAYWQPRWYRFLHNHAFLRGMRRAIPDDKTWQQLVTGTRILMYHAVAKPGEPRDRFVVSLRDFTWQLGWLHRRGYTVISLQTLVEALEENRLPPYRSVVLTFDDGYVDNQAAFALLRRLGLPVTVFAVSRRLGRANDWSDGPPLRDRPLLREETLAELAAAGVAVGAHTGDHSLLTELSAPDLAAELSAARSELGAIAGADPDFLAYPYGESGQREQAGAAAAGFRAACGVRPGGNSIASNLFDLRRDEIFGHHSRWRFRAKFW